MSNRYHLTIKKGATFRKRMRWGRYPYPVERCGDLLLNKQTGRPANPADFIPVDLTGCEARLQVRAEVDSPIVLLDLSTSGGGITLGGPDGTIDLFVADEETAALEWDSGGYDLLIYHPGGEVTRLVQSTIDALPSFTHVV